MKTAEKVIYAIPVSIATFSIANVCRADMLDSLPNWADIVNGAGATANGVFATFSPAMYLAIGIAVGIFGIKFVIGLFRSM